MKNNCHFHGKCEFNADDFHDYDVVYAAFYTTVLEAFTAPVEAKSILMFVLVLGNNHSL